MAVECTLYLARPLSVVESRGVNFCAVKFTVVRCAVFNSVMCWCLLCCVVNERGGRQGRVLTLYSSVVLFSQEQLEDIWCNEVLCSTVKL